MPRLRWSSARPGRGDDDVDAALELAQLAADRRAAVDRQHARAEPPAVPVQRLRHLHAQLAGRHQHQRDRQPAPVAGRELVEDRQRERRGLAGAGRGLAEQVAAREQRRDRLALDRRRLLVAEAGQRLEQLVAQPEVGERGWAGDGRHAAILPRPGAVQDWWRS